MSKEKRAFGVQFLSQEDILFLSTYFDEIIKQELIDVLGKENILDLDVSIEIDFDDELAVTVDVSVVPTALMEDKSKEIIDKVIETAFNKFEQKLKEVVSNAKNRERVSSASER